MATGGVVRAGTALEALVHQFSDPLSFFRELIQNSIDAGTSQVDVWVEFLPEAESESGTLQVRVEDYGQGMTAEVIDHYLTRLFSSTKEDDLTQLGRYGIGFVSVFALDPEAVIVDTSKDGENWRVIFRQDRSFERLARDEPVEGTRVRLLKRIPAGDFPDLEKRARQSVHFWCRHARAEIRFNGQVLSEPFDLPSPCKLRHEEPGTRIVVGYPVDGRPFAGFYNGGLTLQESHERLIWPGVAVKVDSRFLEHTLTRDGVVLDENYAKARALVDRMVADLPRHLFDLLEKEESDLLFRVAACHLQGSWHRVWTTHDLSHETGEADGEAWRAVAGRHVPGLLAASPATGDLPPHQACEARFRLRVAPDPSLPPETLVVRLEVVNEARGGEPVAGRLPFTFREFRRPGHDQDLVLRFYSQPEHKVSFRTAWEGQVGVWQGQVAVRAATQADLGALRRPHLDRLLFRTPAGRRVALREVLGALRRRRLLVAPGPSPLVEPLEARQKLVLQARTGEGPWVLLEALGQEIPRQAHREFCLPLPCTGEEEARWEPLRQALEALLRRRRRPLAGVRLGHLGYPGAGASDRVAVAQARFGDLTPLARAGLEGGLFSRRRTLVVNVDHPAVAGLLEAAGREPEVSAYLLCKLFFLDTALSPEEDSRLALDAWELRCLRPTS